MNFIMKIPIFYSLTIIQYHILIFQFQLTYFKALNADYLLISTLLLI